MLCFSSQNIPPVPESADYIEGVFGLYDIMLLYGKSGEAKSLLALSLCHSLLTEDTFLGLPILERPDEILYVDGENTLHTLKIRLEVLNHPNLMLAIPTIGDKAINYHLEEIEEYFTKFGSKRIVVIDNITSLTDFDQNSQVAIIEFKDFCMRLRDKCGLSVIVIHHANKSGDYHGTSVLSRFPSVILKQRQLSGDRFVLSCEKNRDRESSAFQFTYKFNSNLKPVILKGKEHIADSIPTKILRCLQEEESDGLTAPEIATRLNIKNVDTLQRSLRRLLKKDEIYVEKHRYFIRDNIGSSLD